MQLLPPSHYRVRAPREPTRLIFMLFLTAILRVWTPREPEPNDLLAQTRLRIGHLGLTVIALVFILVTFWQH